MSDMMQYQSVNKSIPSDHRPPKVFDEIETRLTTIYQALALIEEHHKLIQKMLVGPVGETADQVAPQPATPGGKLTKLDFMFGKIDGKIQSVLDLSRSLEEML